jgi:lipopolysaccharide export system protein LptC
VREQLEQASRYSRFVGLMRWALPAAAAVMLLLLFAWPNQLGAPRDLPQDSPSQREMTNPRYQGSNARGEPMTVTASRAVQVGSLEDVIDLTEVTARLERQGGGWVTLEAKNGQYLQKTNRVTLSGQVRLRDEAGYDILTDKAEIDLNTPAQAWGENKVTGRGPRGSINANGFRITDEGKTVMFTGRSRLVLPQGSR